MKLLNLCCGANRWPTEEWVNLDHLFPVLAEGTPERNNLLQEGNYVEHDVLSGPLPFEDGTFSGILASHCAEHWDCQQAVQVMQECLRVLQPGGLLMVSVPDASYFREVHAEDTPENARQLFGEEIYAPDGEVTFFGYGLWNRFHKAILTEDSLWTYFVRAGFQSPWRIGIAISQNGPAKVIEWQFPFPVAELSNRRSLTEMTGLLNRLPFSLVMVGVKE